MKFSEITGYIDLEKLSAESTELTHAVAGKQVIYTASKTCIMICRPDLSAYFRQMQNRRT